MARPAVAIVLHAHLPHLPLRHPFALDTRWLLEAIWESYLPLVDLLERLRSSPTAAPITVSVSPPLAGMLRSPELPPLFDAYLGALLALNARVEHAGSSLAVMHRRELVNFYDRRLRQARASWRRIEGDIVGALFRLQARGALELMTTSVSHALLPALRADGAVEAQLELGRRAFGRRAAALSPSVWLAECAYDDRVDAALARCGCRHAVLAQHGLGHAAPRPPDGSPVVSKRGVTYLPRDQVATLRVWARQGGYPGHPSYREHHLDACHWLPADLLGPFRGGGMTGLKYHRVSASAASPKRPYEPAEAQARAATHAAAFVELLGERAAAGWPVVVAWDAELFGHWWFEGPTFIEQVLRHLAMSTELQALTLSSCAAARPMLPLGRPAASTWGRGGHGQSWLGPANAWAWRHIHHAHRMVATMVAHTGGRAGRHALARDEAVRELLLLEASDWPFLIGADSNARYATARLRRHHQRALAFARCAVGGRDATPPGHTEFLRALHSEGLWGPLLRK